MNKGNSPGRIAGTHGLSFSYTFLYCQYNEKKKLYSFQLHANVQNQILRIFFFAGILPILILGIFSITYTYRQMNAHYRTQITADAIRVNSVLFDITTTVYTSSETLTNSESYQDFFASEGTAKRPEWIPRMFLS